MEDRVILERIRFALGRVISREMAEDIEVSSYIDFLTGDIKVKFEKDIMGRKIDLIVYPRDWKEALKERWVPKFILKRFPVKYKAHNIYALYPSLKYDIGDYKAEIYAE